MADKLSASKLRRARAASEALFKAKHRLPMALVVAAAKDDDLYAAVLAARAGTTEMQAAAELRHFASAGLLQLATSPARSGRGAGRPPKLYKRRTSPFWELAAVVVADFRPPK